MGEGGQHIPNFELVSLGHFTIEAMLNYGTIMIFFKVNHYIMVWYLCLDQFWKFFDVNIANLA